jgi:hypothetical protein
MSPFRKEKNMSRKRSLPNFGTIYDWKDSQCITRMIVLQQEAQEFFVFVFGMLAEHEIFGM